MHNNLYTHSKHHKIVLTESKDVNVVIKTLGTLFNYHTNFIRSKNFYVELLVLWKYRTIVDTVFTRVQ